MHRRRGGDELGDGVPGGEISRSFDVGAQTFAIHVHVAGGGKPATLSLSFASLVTAVDWWCALDKAGFRPLADASSSAAAAAAALTPLSPTHANCKTIQTLYSAFAAKKPAEMAACYRCAVRASQGGESAARVA